MLRFAILLAAVLALHFLECDGSLSKIFTSRPPPAPIFNHKNKRPRQAVISDPSSNFDKFTKQSEQLNSLFNQNEKWSAHTFPQDNFEINPFDNRNSRSNQRSNFPQQQQTEALENRNVNPYGHQRSNFPQQQQTEALENRNVNPYENQRSNIQQTRVDYVQQQRPATSQYTTTRNTGEYEPLPPRSGGRQGISCTSKYEQYQQKNEYPSYNQTNPYGLQEPNPQHQSYGVYSRGNDGNRSSHHLGFEESGPIENTPYDVMTNNPRQVPTSARFQRHASSTARSSSVSESSTNNKAVPPQKKSQEQKNDSSRKNTGKEMFDKSLRVVTTSISGVKRWAQQKDNIQMVFEVFGMVVTAPSPDMSNMEKEFVIKDEKDTLTCVFFEIDRSMPNLMRGQWHRCVGNYNVSENKFHCVSTRKVSQEERKIAKLNSALVEKTLMRIVKTQREA